MKKLIVLFLILLFPIIVQGADWQIWQDWEIWDGNRAVGGGAAPASENFVTIGNSGNLSAERALTPGTGMSLVDGGANSTVTLNTVWSRAGIVLSPATANDDLTIDGDVNFNADANFNFSLTSERIKVTALSGLTVASENFNMAHFDNEMTIDNPFTLSGAIVKIETNISGAGTNAMLGLEVTNGASPSWDLAAAGDVGFEGDLEVDGSVRIDGAVLRLGFDAVAFTTFTQADDGLLTIENVSDGAAGYIYNLDGVEGYRILTSQTPIDVMHCFNCTEVDADTDGVSNGSTTFTSANSDFVTTSTVGDIVFISDSDTDAGEGTYIIVTITDLNTLVLDRAITGSETAIDFQVLADGIVIENSRDATAKILLPVDNDSTAPSISFGDGTYGIYSSANGTINSGADWAIDGSFTMLADISIDSADAATEFLRLTDSYIPSSGENTSTIKHAFYFTNDSGVSTEATHSETYKIGDWEGAGTENDAGWKLFTTNDDTPTLALTIDNFAIATFVGRATMPALRISAVSSNPTTANNLVIGRNSLLLEGATPDPWELGISFPTIDPNSDIDTTLLSSKLATEDAAVTSSGLPIGIVTETYQVDHTDFTAAAVTEDLTIVTLPARAVLMSALLVVNVAESTATALTLSLGSAAANYDQIITDSNAKAAANTVYGDDDAERSGDLPDADVLGYKLYSYTATQDITLHVDAGAENVTAAAEGFYDIHLTYMVLPTVGE